MTELHRNLIAGDWVEGEGETENINPSNTEEVVGTYARASKADTDRAIAAAKAAAPAWARFNIHARYEILKKASDEILARKEELGRLLAREEGKTLAEGIGEATRAGQIFAFFAGEAVRISGELLTGVRPNTEVLIEREPVGVVGLITPWNFPIAIPAWKMAPALAYGNTVVFKPADLVPGCGWELADILNRAGLPKGVFNLVMGKGSVVGQAILDNPDVNAISFTGSVETGKRVAKASAEHMRKFQLEMGGKSPLVVLDDADLKTAVECAANGAFFSTGQRCTASSRLVVTEGIHDKFVDGLIERIKALNVDDALKDGTHIGPVVDKKQFEQDEMYIDVGRKEGAKLAWGGERLNRAHARLLPAAGALHRDEERHAHQPRGDFWAGGERDPRQELRRGAAGRERHAVRALVRHLHDQPEIRDGFPQEQRGRHGDDQPADGGRRLPRAVRRPKRLVLWRARAGALCGGVLHGGEDDLSAGGVSDMGAARAIPSPVGRGWGRGLIRRHPRLTPPPKPSPHRGRGQ